MRTVGMPPMSKVYTASIDEKLVEEKRKKNLCSPLFQVLKFNDSANPQKIPL